MGTHCGKSVKREIGMGSTRERRRSTGEPHTSRGSGLQKPNTSEEIKKTNCLAQVGFQQIECNQEAKNLLDNYYNRRSFLSVPRYVPNMEPVKMKINQVQLPSF